MWSNHVLNDINLTIWKQSHLSLYGLQLQLCSISELIVLQQNDFSGGEAVCHDNFKIEGEKWVELEGEREYVQLCVEAS